MLQRCNPVPPSKFLYQLYLHLKALAVCTNIAIYAYNLFIRLEADTIRSGDNEVKIMFDFLMQLSFIGLMLIIGAALLYMVMNSLKNATAFQKLNRFTMLAVISTFLGLIFLQYSLFNSLLGSILVLLLIRISYVIYIDTE